MINRILIRIKVVQLLYSYLLTENHFMLESLPSQPTKEKRFAYSLYLDMLVLMVLTARGITRRGGAKPLEDNRFTQILLHDEKIKSMLLKAQSSSFPFPALASSLSEEIKEMQLFKDYAKTGSIDVTGDVKVFQEIFKNVVMKSPKVLTAIKERENYSARGVERMEEMINETFKNLLATHSPADAMNSLRFSLDKARELYFRLLHLPIELTRLMREEIEANRKKLRPTAADLHPNTRFIDNQLVASLEKDTRISEYIDKHKAVWLPDEDGTLRHLLRDIKDSEVYKEYMAASYTDYYNDCEFWRNIYKSVIFPSADFLEALEDKSIFWNDDVDIIGTFVLKTFKRFAEETPSHPARRPEVVLDMYKDREDAEFSGKLFNAVVKNKEYYRNLIDDAVHKESWDTERLAFMDVVILLTAIAELLNFPKIPVRVTLNEYIEMAKSYSTAKSGGFINGILGNVITRLRAEGKLLKE